MFCIDDSIIVVYISLYDIMGLEFNSWEIKSAPLL